MSNRQRTTRKRRNPRIETGGYTTDKKIDPSKLRFPTPASERPRKESKSKG